MLQFRDTFPNGTLLRLGLNVSQSSRSALLQALHSPRAGPAL